jgi:8-oxo-dGTP diphosphatase
VTAPPSVTPDEGEQFDATSAARSPDGVVEAAGVVCWREVKVARGGPGVLEVLLVHSTRHNEWGWPKGKREIGEPLPVCAVREVAEETGTRVVLGRPLPSTSYLLPDGRKKVVRYWAARPTFNQAPTADLDEIDQTRWVPAEEAFDLLSHPEDAVLLATVRGYAEADVLETSPMVVLRHARSRPRDSWSRADADRPLVAAGKRQAMALVPLLACWEPRYVLCSPWQRCRQTLNPFAAATGVKVRTKGGLTEDGGRRHPGKAKRHVRTLLVHDESSLLCTHRTVLPRVLEALADAGTDDAAADLPKHDPYLEPAEVLVAHVARRLPGRREPLVVAVERHRPR